MRRRDVVAVLAGGAAWPRAAQAQSRVRRVGVLMSYREGDSEGEVRLAAFRESLRAAGADGGNAGLEVRWMAGDPDRATSYAREMVALAPDVILVNGTAGLAALVPLTATIPIVFVVVTNPVGAGFVTSLARPGGNITGFSTFEPEIGGKWLETLKAIAPGVVRAGVLHDPGARGFSALWERIEAVAPSFGMRTVPIHARSRPEIEAGIEAFVAGGPGALVVLPTPVNSVQRQTIFALAERHRLPAMYPFGFHAREGGLVAYGFDAIELFRRAGPYVMRILSGEKPANLPVQAPTKYELVVNLRAARALGLTIPPAILARADDVIE